MFALALGAGRLLFPENQGFEAMLALGADVFKYRHVILGVCQNEYTSFGGFSTNRIEPRHLPKR